MRLRRGSVALGGALVAALALVAGAQAGNAENKVAMAKPVCKIGQSPKYDHCTTGPLFVSSKTECSTATSLLEAAAPSLTFPNGYEPFAFPNTLECFWKVNGMSQAAAIGITGWRGKYIPYLKHEGMAHPDHSLENETVAQAFEDSYKSALGEWQPQYSFCPFPNLAAAQQPGANPPPPAKPEMTTVDGHEAWISDPCPVAPDSTSPQYPQYVRAGEVRELGLLDGDVLYTIRIRDDVGKAVDANGLMTIARGLIATYQKFAP